MGVPGERILRSAHPFSLQAPPLGFLPTHFPFRAPLGILPSRPGLSCRSWARGGRWGGEGKAFPEARPTSGHKGPLAGWGGRELDASRGHRAAEGPGPCRGGPRRALLRALEPRLRGCRRPPTPRGRAGATEVPGPRDRGPGPARRGRFRNEARPDRGVAHGPPTPGARPRSVPRRQPLRNGAGRREPASAQPCKVLRETYRRARRLVRG